MRIGIMGSGGLGGYFGARLVHGGGADVHFVARGQHLEAMRSDGLRIEGPEPLHVKVQATEDPYEIGPVDLLMLCVKLWDTESAIRQACRWWARIPRSFPSRTASSRTSPCARRSTGAR